MIAGVKKQVKEINDRDPLTEKIIACAYRVHNELGPGFNENIYHRALEVCLDQENLEYLTEKSFNIIFLNKNVGKLRLDLVVEDKVIVEVKAVIGNMPLLFESQILSYLKAASYNVGLLMNFGNRSCQIRRLMP